MGYQSPMYSKVQVYRTSYLSPAGYQSAMASPTIRPKAAPILKLGMRTPVGTGRVAARMERKNVLATAVNILKRKQISKKKRGLKR